MKTAIPMYEGDGYLRDAPFDAELPTLVRLADAFAILRELVVGTAAGKTAPTPAAPPAARPPSRRAVRPTAISRVHAA